MRTLQPERGSERSYGYDSKIGIYNTMYYLVVAGMSRRGKQCFRCLPVGVMVVCAREVLVAIKPCFPS